jgi:hypothetical protein
MVLATSLILAAGMAAMHRQVQIEELGMAVA